MLVIGSSGREAALCRKLMSSKLLDKLYVTGFIAGIDAEFLDVDITDVVALRELAISLGIDVCIVGPELPLECGVVDEFERFNIKIFGPSKSAALLETDKAFCKGLLKEFGIATASFEVFDSVDLAVEYSSVVNFPIVVKYSGLAAGKGVVIVEDALEYESTVRRLMADGGVVVVEEFLVGEEFSYIGVVGKSGHFEPFVCCRDYKREFDGDLGENTGGMGMICPHPLIDAAYLEVARELVNQTLLGLKARGIDYHGFIYAGLMKTASGIKVIEFNARMGDPEGEILFTKLESDILEVVVDCLNSKCPIIKFDSLVYHGVVLAAPGYPRVYERGIDVSQFDFRKVLAMNVTKDLRSSGGRVLFYFSSGDTLEQAYKNTYQELVNFKDLNLIFRSDIGRNFLS